MKKIICTISIMLVTVICVSAYTPYYYYNKNPNSSIGGFSIANISSLTDKYGHNVVDHIKTYGCYVTSYAMVLKTLGAKTVAKQYDNRTSSTGYLTADPFTVTLANLSFPTTSGDVLNGGLGTSTSPVYINSAANLVNYFGKTTSTVSLDGKSEATKKYNLNTYINKYPQGVILEFSGTSGTHALVLIESNYISSSTTRAADYEIIEEEYIDIPFGNPIETPSVMPRYVKDSGNFNSSNNGDDFVVYDPAYYGSSSDGSLKLSDTWTSQEFGWDDLIRIRIIKDS